MRGHLATLGAEAHRLFRPPPPLPGRPWTTTIIDPVMGDVRLTGRFVPAVDRRDVVVIVHGLGGSAESAYVAAAGHAAARCGYAVLALSLRGADRSGEDVHHAGLSADLDAAVASPELSEFERVHVLGFSLGGHVALHFATSTDRPASVIAVCPPLDLAHAQRHIDRPVAALYRRHLLRSLTDIVNAAHERGRAPCSPQSLRGVRTLREFDARVVVSRFGFADPDDYYARTSVGPRLGRIAAPTWIVSARHDPMVPPTPRLETSPSSSTSASTSASTMVTHVQVAGGHLALRGRELRKVFRDHPLREAVVAGASIN